MCISWTSDQATGTHITNNNEKCWIHTPDIVVINDAPIKGLMQYLAYRCSLCQYCYLFVFLPPVFKNYFTLGGVLFINQEELDSMIAMFLLAP